jgi:hypothetical protein
MLMLDGASYILLLDIVIAARHLVDVLVIPGLFLVKNLLDNKLHSKNKISACKQSCLLGTIT